MTKEEAMKELSYIADDMPSMECAKWIEAISMGIKALEQTRWIPVSEKLPEKMGRYLVTCKIGFSLNEDIENDETVDIAFYKDGHWFKYILHEDIYAWMPLPELYRPDSIMIYPQVEGITPTVVEPSCNSIKTEQELSRDMKEIKEIINCDTNVEIKLKMITNIIYSKPHYFKALQQESCRCGKQTDRRSNQINGDNKIEHDSAIDTSNKTLPPDTPTEKVGQWTEGGFDFNYWICSKCEYQPNNDYSKPSYNYCPNCGAKMQEVKNEY